MKGGVVAVRLEARPARGVKESWSRVAVYDAAPVKVEPAGEFEHVDYRHLADVIVWLERVGAGERGADSTSSPQAGVGDVVMTVDGRGARGVAGARVGARVGLKNVSGRAMPLYSVSEGNEFDLGTVPAGEWRGFVAKAEGLVEVLSDPGKGPVAKVYVAPSGWVRRGRAGEVVEFRGVPEGTWKVVTWHERLPGGEKVVEVRKGEVVSVRAGVGVGQMKANAEH